jgi:alginate O-acetyltransferase complex protein AlgI
VTFTDFSFYGLFLGVVLACGLCPRDSWRQVCLLVASLYMYYSLEPLFVGVLILLILVNYALGLALRRGSQRRLLYWVSLVVNFGLLIVLKYGTFFRDNLQVFLNFTPYHLPEVPVWLPVGISFFIFQIQSYIFDVYYRVIPAEPSLLRFALYVSFFPQLVAGPIVKARHFLPQLSVPAKICWAEIRKGLLEISTGLMLKVVVADNLAQFTLALQVPMVEVRHSINLLVLSWAFMIQVFGDFAGYSSIAIGLARCFGYQLPQNFNLPFLATSFNDFWKRWHISLTQWFKDYVFLRLATQSRLKGRPRISLMLTFLLSGLWHGANWSYIIWGGLHGLGCIAETRRMKKTTSVSKWILPLKWLMTFQLVCFLGIFFYHQRLHDVLVYFEALFVRGWSQPLIWPRVADMLFFMLPVVFMHGIGFWETHKKIKWGPVAQGLGLALNIVLLCSLWGEQRGFIYFAF